MKLRSFVSIGSDDWIPMEDEPPYYIDRGEPNDYEPPGNKYIGANMRLVDYVIGNTVSKISGEVVDQIKTLVLTKNVYTIDITEYCRRYDPSIFIRLFKNIPVKMKPTESGENYLSLLNNRTCRDVVDYMGCKILVCTGSIYNGNDMSVTLSVINRKHHKKVLDKFVDKLERQLRKSEVYNPHRVGWLSGCGFRYYFNKSQRTLDDVFVPKKTLNELYTAISGFKNNKDWYSKHLIPYHFGILLYGPPGTGKSSLITALSNKYQVTPHYVSVSNIRELLSSSDQIKRELSKTDDIKFVIVEDVDSCEFLSVYEYDEEEDDMPDFPKLKWKKEFDFRQTALSDFLNMMDGSDSFENVIWIFTTNHLEKLEPSLIRAGRMDIKLLIDYADEETFGDFILYHFNKDLPEGFKIRDNVSLAEVQNDIIMGLTCGEIIEKYSATNQ